MKTETKRPWITLCRRTEDPKLLYIEKLLATHGIDSRRNGYSFHGPILEVRRQDLEAAWEMLMVIDEYPDHDEMFERNPPGFDEWVEHHGEWVPCNLQDRFIGG